MRPINEIIIHATATRPNFMANSTPQERVKEIRRWHMEDRHWADIGYHYLIDRDGAVLDGRPVGVVGAHVVGHNTGSIGVALFGGHGSSENDAFEEHFTPAQEKALRGLISDLRARYAISKVTGHNQYAAKACPGFNVPRWLERQTPARASLMSSKTMQATTGAAVAGAGGVITALGSLDPTTQMLVIGFAALALVGLVVIAWERIRKWGRGVK